MCYAQQKGLGISWASIPAIVPSVIPKRMLPGAGGRGAPQLPGFNATMKLHPDSHFFTDRRGHEWGFNSTRYHLDPLGGGPAPQVIGPESADWEWHSTQGAGMAPEYVIEDLKNLLAFGSIRRPAAVPKPSPQQPGAAIPSDGANGAVVTAGFTGFLPLLLLGGLLLGGVKKR